MYVNDVSYLFVIVVTGENYKTFVDKMETTTKYISD